MNRSNPLLPPRAEVEALPDGTVPCHRGVFATRSHDMIQRWAARRDAEPATGEESRSGPGTVDIKDGHAAIRFNFPGASPFRPIAWSEWFEHFDRYNLTFVFEEIDSEPLSSRFRIVRSPEVLAPELDA